MWRGEQGSTPPATILDLPLTTRIGRVGGEVLNLTDALLAEFPDERSNYHVSVTEALVVANDREREELLLVLDRNAASVTAVRDSHLSR